MKTIIIIGIALFILIILAKYYKRRDVVEGLAMCPESHKFPYQIRGPFVGTPEAKAHYNKLWAWVGMRLGNDSGVVPDTVPDETVWGCCETDVSGNSQNIQGKLTGDTVGGVALDVSRNRGDRICPNPAIKTDYPAGITLDIIENAEWNKGRQYGVYGSTGVFTVGPPPNNDSVGERYWGDGGGNLGSVPFAESTVPAANPSPPRTWASWSKFMEGGMGTDFSVNAGWYEKNSAHHYRGTANEYLKMAAVAEKLPSWYQQPWVTNAKISKSKIRSSNSGGGMGLKMARWVDAGTELSDASGWLADTGEDWEEAAKKSRTEIINWLDGSNVVGFSEQPIKYSNQQKLPTTIEKIYKCGADKDAICPDKFHPSIQMYDKYSSNGTRDASFSELGDNLNSTRWSDCSHLNKNCGLPVDYETVAADVFSTYPVPSEKAFADASKIPLNFFPNILKASSGDSGWLAQIDDNDAIKTAANRCSSTCSAMENCTGCFSVSGLVDPSFIDWAKRNIQSSEVESDKAVGFFLAKNLTASVDGQASDASSAIIIAKANDSINLANSTWYTTARQSLHTSTNKINLDFPGWRSDAEDMSGVILTPPEGLMSKWHSNGCITNVLPVPDGLSWTGQYNENNKSFDGPNNLLLTHCNSNNQAKSMWCCAHTSCSDISGVSCGKGVDDSRGKYYDGLSPEEISKNAAAGGGLSYDASSTIQDTLYIQSQIWLKGLSYSDSSPDTPGVIREHIDARILDISGSKAKIDDILQKISSMAANDKAVVRVAAAKEAGSKDGGGGTLSSIKNDITTAANYRKNAATNAVDEWQADHWLKYAIADSSNLNTDPKGWRDNYNLIMPIKDRYDNSIAILTQKREALSARIALAGQLCLRESSMAHEGQCPTSPMSKEELLNFDKDRISTEKDYTEAAVKKQCRIVDANLLTEIDTQRDQIKLQSEEIQLQSEEIENAQSMEESYARLIGDYSKVLDKAITVIPSHAQISAATKSLQTAAPQPLQTAATPQPPTEGFMSRRKTKYSIQEGYTSTKDGYGNINITCRNNGGAAGAGAGASGAGGAAGAAGASGAGGAAGAGAAGAAGFDPGHQFDHGGLMPFGGGCS